MMNALTFLSNAFSLISGAMLIPVMLGLLLGLLMAFLCLGRLLRELMERYRFAKERADYSAVLESPDAVFAALSDNGGVLAGALNKIQNASGNTLLIDKTVAETEAYWQSQLEKLQTWVRIGPSLGLMGTLIPLGPGLLALASGDLKTLSDNLIVAFATTVVGVLIGLICGGVHTIRKRWYRNDAILLTFTAERMIPSSKKEVPHET
ncbi:MAG: MotA/TolQ/ExbB proton channel family protein [Planctomycetaceae bacterium]|nr:MotA/TolQ/ExbB proton channel family protein [Planctomycetaceae bacterium]